MSEKDLNVLGIRVVDMTASIGCSLCLIPFIAYSPNMRRKLK